MLHDDVPHPCIHFYPACSCLPFILYYSLHLYSLHLPPSLFFPPLPFLPVNSGSNETSI